MRRDAWRVEATTWTVGEGGPVVEIRGAVMFPQYVELDDIFHEQAGDRVDLPDDRCALCRAGLCVQLQDREEKNLVRHGRLHDA